MNKLTTALGATTLAAVTTLSGCGSTPPPAAEPPAASSTPTSAPTSAPTSGETTPVTHTTALGPTGYGTLTLGMGFRAAMATGLVARTPAHSGQAMSYVLAGHPRAGLCLTRAHGLEAIFAYPGLATPEGLKDGSTKQQALAAYPSARAGIDSWTTPAGSHGARYAWGIEQDGTVSDLRVEVAGQHCYD